MTTGSRSAGTLGITLFNVQNSAPERARKQAAWLDGRPHSDVLVLTEVGSGPGSDALVGELTERGFAHWHAPRPAARDYRTVLATRNTPMEPVPGGLGPLSHRGPAARIYPAGGTPLGLWGLYVPSRGSRERRNVDKRAFQQAVRDALPALLHGFAADPVVVTGDLNVVEPDHEPAHRVFGGWEYDFYRAFGQAGLTDAVRRFAATAPGHSWYSRTGNGFRFDHAFANAPDRLVSCAYDHTPRRLKLSDHACLALRIDVTHPLHTAEGSTS
ncbi:endonuclease/exonuclease/phosphatase family protein [Streptomyces rubiginosohelvolus]|uniref:endonuclease/exonuclease/phosphatase family protein n=1 Tax=Streptomyces rubiginosohelvolus TaxID=67362 RepID=UPI0037AD7F9C